MTLNQVKKRIQTIVQSHRQVRSYDAQLLQQDFNNDKTNKYPAVQLRIENGLISPGRHASTVDFIMTFEDLVHVSEDTKQNDWDVVSDMIGIGEDIVAQLNNPNYNDWRISGDNNFRVIAEDGNDLTAGVELRFTVAWMYPQNRCLIPSDLVVVNIQDMDSKVYDLIYVATGAEGNTLTLPTLLGKKVILITREMAPIYKVNVNPDPAEFTWNNTSIGLGTVTNIGERFLILYRNY